MRCFRRYRKRHTVRVFKGSESHYAEILDYSLDGVNVVMRDSLQISKGDVIMIDSEDLSLRSDFTVKWLSETPDGLRMGLHKIAPLRGSLRDYRLSDVFIGLQRSLRTGIFNVASGSVRKKIYIKNGDMIFGTSNQDADRLGDVLLKEGRITKEAFDRSSELILKTGKRQGAILVELGALSPKELFSAVKHQVEGIILSLFDLPEGEFEFQEGQLPTEEIITLKLAAAHLIYRGVKRPACIEQVNDYLDLPLDTVLTFSEDPLNLFQDVPFDGEDRRIVSLINGRRTIGEIISLAEMEEAGGRKSVAALLSTSIVEAVQQETPRETITSDDILYRPEIPKGLIEEIEEKYREYPRLDHYQVLGVEESVTDPRLRWAFYRLAKEYHPDRHFYLDHDVKEKLHTVFSCIVKAYNVLSSQEKRKEYDRILGEVSADPLLSRRELSRKKFLEGTEAYNQKKYEQSAQLLAEAVSLDDSVAPYHHHYGLALAKLDRPKEAERVLGRALKLDGKNDEIMTALGYVYLKLGFPLRAQRNFRKALEINPDNKGAQKGMQISGKGSDPVRS